MSEKILPPGAHYDLLGDDTRTEKHELSNLWVCLLPNEKGGRLYSASTDRNDVTGMSTLYVRADRIRELVEHHRKSRSGGIVRIEELFRDLESLIGTEKP